MDAVAICCDTFRADIVGQSGGLSFVRTSHLDDFASESLVFDRCYAEGLPTIPVRRYVFTGQPSFSWRFSIENEGLQPAGGEWHPIPHQLDTLAEILHDAGYTTGLVSEVYHMFKPTMNFTSGFLSWRFIRGQENDGYRSGPVARVDLAAHTPEDDPGPADHPVILQYLLNMLDRQEGEEHYLVPSVFRTAAQWVEDNRHRRPFFLWVDSFSPHELWDPPRQYANAYYADPSVKDFIHHSVLRGYDPTESEVERTKALYCGYVTFVDRWIGHLLETIDGVGLRDDTAVVFFSDYGTQLMDRGKFRKGGTDLFPFNTRLNCMIRHPDGVSGRSQAWIQNQDLFSTVLGLADVSHGQAEGQNVWSLANGAPGARDHVVTGWGQYACVRDGGWSAHADVTGTDPPTFHDLAADPDEARPGSNVAAEVRAQTEKRLTSVVSSRPFVFNEYSQRNQARSLRTFVSQGKG